jgi:hypothetical protein
MENIVELFDSGSEEDIEYINHNYLSNKVNLVALARNLYHRNTLVHMDYMIKVLMLEINAMEYIMKNISAKKDSINELDIDELFSELKNRMKALKGMKTELSNKMDKKISSFSKNMANYAKNKEKIVGKKAQMIEPLAAAMDL